MLSSLCVPLRTSATADPELPAADRPAVPALPRDDAEPAVLAAALGRVTAAGVAGAGRAAAAGAGVGAGATVATVFGMDDAGVDAGDDKGADAGADVGTAAEPDALGSDGSNFSRSSSSSFHAAHGTWKASLDGDGVAEPPAWPTGGRRGGVAIVARSSEPAGWEASLLLRLDLTVAS